MKHSSESKKARGSHADPHRPVPSLLILVAIMSIVVLGLATAAMASAATSPSAASDIPRAPMTLPGPSASATGTGASDTKHWILGAKPAPRTASIAKSFNALSIGGDWTGIYRVRTSVANRFAKKLRNTVGLIYAEPDVKVTSAGYPSDLLWDQETWLNQIVNTTDVTPPPVTAASPRLGLIEQGIDRNHPDLIKADLTHAKSVNPQEDAHGTAVAGIAGSPAEGLGIRGVWPGMAMRQFPSGDTCSSTTAAVIKAVKSKVSVINMSYGFAGDSCYSHYLATEAAVQRGILPVASAGNTFGDGGNVSMRPASDPHVISVSAVDGNDLEAPFATENDDVDITAPGVDVFAPTITNASDAAAGKPAYGWALLSGTSFSAPMVAAAATWLHQVRPTLDASQITRVLTDSATDLGAPGRDPEYGDGLLNIGSALVADAPPSDALEPNDDINWINGTLLPKKAKFVWKGGTRKKKSVTATLSRPKDPADVYQIKIPARRQVLITAAQFQGDVRLDVLKPSAKTIVHPGKKLIVRSDRPAPKTEGVRVRNLKKKIQTVYVSVTPSPRNTDEYDFYRLTVRPSR